MSARNRVVAQIGLSAFRDYAIGDCVALNKAAISSRFSSAERTATRIAQ